MKCVFLLPGSHAGRPPSAITRVASAGTDCSGSRRDGRQGGRGARGGRGTAVADMQFGDVLHGSLFGGRRGVEAKEARVIGVQERTAGPADARGR